MQSMMTETKYAELQASLRRSGSYAENEPLHHAVRRITDERDSERARANRYRGELERAGNLAVEATKRITQLENEIIRLNLIHPVKCSEGEPVIGSWIKVTATKSDHPIAISVGEMLKVGNVVVHPNGDYVWVTTGKADYGIDGERFGWVQWVQTQEPEAQAAATPATEDRSRLGRQRRELRRLNQSQRLMKLEMDRAQRLFEDSAAVVIELRRALRLAEAQRDP